MARHLWEGRGPGFSASVDRIEGIKTERKVDLGIVELYLDPQCHEG